MKKLLLTILLCSLVGVVSADNLVGDVSSQFNLKMSGYLIVCTLTNVFLFLMFASTVKEANGNVLGYYIGIGVVAGGWNFLGMMFYNLNLSNPPLIGTTVYVIISLAAWLLGAVIITMRSDK